MLKTRYVVYAVNRGEYLTSVKAPIGWSRDIGKAIKFVHKGNASYWRDTLLENMTFGRVLRMEVIG